MVNKQYRRVEQIGGYCIIFLTMSLFSILFGCNDKKIPEKQQQEAPRFPASDNPEAKVMPVVLDGDFWVQSFFITPDKQSVYVLGVRDSGPKKSMPEGYEPNPGEVRQADYRLYCLDAKGNSMYHKDMLRTDWLDGGSFGLLESQLLLRIGDCFLVLDPKNFDILEKIPVHNSAYISWKETTMTFDEHQADYQKRFDKLYENPDAKWLDWSPVPEYLVFVQGPKGKRSAWYPMSYEDDLLADLKKRFEPILVSCNPHVISSNADTNFQLTDGPSKILEAAHLSGGTQLDYPNYKSRSVLQYEMVLNQKVLHFSTSDRDRHDLRLRFSDNLYLTTHDGAAWTKYEGVLYRIE